MYNAPYIFTKRPVTASYNTPQWFFDELDSEFHFDIDLAASAENSKCKRFFTYEDNALEQTWRKRVCWCNPPWGGLRHWIKKAWEESQLGSTVVMLAPVRSETKAWQEFVIGKKPEVRFLPYKLKFANMKDTFPQSLVLIVWRPHKIKSPEEWGSIGGKLSSSRMTPEERRDRALKAVQAREAKKNKN